MGKLSAASRAPLGAWLAIYQSRRYRTWEFRSLYCLFPKTSIKVESANSLGWEYEIARAETLEELRGAIPYLEWCAKNALPPGVLAEQVHPIDGRPLSVSPLILCGFFFLSICVP